MRWAASLADLMALKRAMMKAARTAVKSAKLMVDLRELQWDVIKAVQMGQLRES